MSKSNCRRTAERLAAYVDEALPADERGEVERHLERCPPCLEAALREKVGRKALRSVAAKLGCESLPPGLRERCEAIARERRKRKVD
jgi:anti-sigma factor RsiW